MRAEIKYLSFGLFVGMGTTALLLTGMFLQPKTTASKPTNTQKVTPTRRTATPLSSPTERMPTNTYTPTPTYVTPSATPASTFTPSPTPTVPSPTPTFSNTIAGLYESGTLTQVGPLTLRQQFNVYDASIKYIRETSEASRVLGEEINGTGYGAPSDICGPLAIAILQEAGIVDTDLNPHTFWLLNPHIWDDRRLLSKAFPPERFESIRVQVRLDQVDWYKTPLYPGDFVYIYAGSGGNFEHMLVVSRIDSQGRAYAVTNHNTENGFIITEVLLYNPDKSNVGMFPVWTERPNKEMGATGFGGFEVWRIKSR